MSGELNRTAIRHAMLAAVSNGEVTVMVEALALGPVLQRSLDVLRDRGFVTPSGTNPAALTESGLELLNKWDTSFGPVGE